MSMFRMDHLHLRSIDPEAAARFYVEALGARETGRVPVPAGERIILMLAGQTLFVEQVPAGTAAPPAPPFLGLEHLGLAVDDLDAALDALKAKGVTVASGPSSPRPGIRIAFIAAPDGARIELVERRTAPA
jgi:catechol 2,3-dioxygenase-like lactoylglutathione lyase family enzyme